MDVNELLPTIFMNKRINSLHVSESYSRGSSSRSLIVIQGHSFVLKKSGYFETLLMNHFFLTFMFAEASSTTFLEDGRKFT